LLFWGLVTLNQLSGQYIFQAKHLHPMRDERPLQNAPFCSISAPALWNAQPIPLGSSSNFNPRNTQCIPAVKFFAVFELKQNLTFFRGFMSSVLMNSLCLCRVIFQ
jgi:hypothetical protein